MASFDYNRSFKSVCLKAVARFYTRAPFEPSVKIGFIRLELFGKPDVSDDDMDVMDFAQPSISPF
jgi:hypothetical protein